VNSRKERQTQGPGSQTEPGAPSASLNFREKYRLLYSPRFLCQSISNSNPGHPPDEVR
jgi:hypothetical protein